MGRNRNMFSVYGEETKREEAANRKNNRAEVNKLTHTVISELYRKSGNDDRQMLNAIWDIADISKVLNCESPLDDVVISVVNNLNEMGCFKAKRKIKLPSGNSNICLFRFNSSVIDILNYVKQ